METAMGVILGILASIFVSHYYFRRTVSKSLGIYRVLNSFIFAGIANDVRKKLHFRFQDKEVEELQQLVFLIANDGERAIRDIIEPLKVLVPGDVEVLDASIIHRYPNALQADIKIENGTSGTTRMSFEFPLLNKQEYFVVKLLLSGRLKSEDLVFSVLSDDLPRDLKLTYLSTSSYRDAGYKFEWGAAIAGFVVCLLAGWSSYALYLLYELRPELCPYPWSSFVLSFESVFLLLVGFFICFLFSLIGLMALASSLFGGEFPPSKKSRFPLPKEIKDMIFPYRVMHFPPEFAERATEIREEKKAKT